MRLYLIRHAEALPNLDDSARTLSSRGKQEVAELGKFFRGTEAFQPDRVWHSPYVRARETAELLLRELSLTPPIFETPGLLPEDNPIDIVTRLAELRPFSSLAIVGHNPHLSILATLLVRGRPNPLSFDFEKGAVLALDRAEELYHDPHHPQWTVVWMICPSLLSPEV